MEIELEYGIVTKVAAIEMTDDKPFNENIFIIANFSMNNFTIWIKDNNDYTRWNKTINGYFEDIIGDYPEGPGNRYVRFTLWAKSSTLGNNTLRYKFFLDNVT